MEKQLNCSPLRLPLKEMALRRAVVNLWNDDDILSIIENLRDYSFKVWRDTVEVHVRNKVSKLVLPESLKNQMRCLVRPIGSDILRWKCFHENYLTRIITKECFSMHILKQLHWTCVGAIDYCKTAKELLRLEMLDTVKRFRLACYYCFVDYIPLLWEELDKERQLAFVNDPSDILRNIRLELVWPYILKGKASVLDKTANKFPMITRGLSFNQYVIESSARLGNKAGTEYFLQFLTTEERDDSLTAAFHAVIRGNYHPWNFPPTFLDGRLGDVLHHLLSEMSPERQMEVLRKYPCHILFYFLDWPWHDVFLDIADLVLTFLPERHYRDLVHIVKNGEFYFPNLFQKLFLDRPQFRNELVRFELGICTKGLFTAFFRDEDTETILVVLRNVSECNRARLVSSLHFIESLDGLIMNDKWRLIDLCYREAALSEENREKLKSRSTKWLERKCESEILLRKHKWKKFFKLLDEIDGSAPQKSSLEDGTVTKAKKSPL